MSPLASSFLLIHIGVLPGIDLLYPQDSPPSCLMTMWSN